MTALHPTPQEVYNKAVDDFRKADAIEKHAKVLRASAREKILAFWAANPTEFQRVPGEKTLTYGGINISVPVKKGEPAKFDDSRAAEADAKLADASPAAAFALFHEKPVFAGPQAVIDFCREYPGAATAIASVLMAFTIPATPDTDDSPRVSPAKLV